MKNMAEYFVCMLSIIEVTKSLRVREEGFIFFCLSFKLMSFQLLLSP